MVQKPKTYNNLIDLCINLESDSEFSGKADHMFNHLLSNYFFDFEISTNKNFELFLNNFDPPPFLKNKKSLMDINIDDLAGYVNSDTINNSLSGKIMLSPQYLKAFYSHHTPSYSQLPEDIKFELIDKVKNKNSAIISAFEKMFTDKEADKNRQIITLVALIIKNIHLKSGRPLTRLSKPVDEIIRSIFQNSDEIFKAADKQIRNLKDDSKIKQIIKAFFPIKQFKELNEISDLFKTELERFIKRAKSASG
jgi:hypothetical protein